MTKIIDADGHIVEPRQLWQKYIDPKFRDRRVKIEGKLLPRSPLMIAAMCVPGGLCSPDRARQLSWDDVRPGSFDPQAHIQDMDDEGVDVSFLYPSIGLTYGSMRDPELAAACCCAYNNWMADFCKTLSQSTLQRRTGSADRCQRCD